MCIRDRIASRKHIEKINQVIEEALKFCEKWYAEDQHEMAATALVYAKMTLKDLERCV